MAEVSNRRQGIFIDKQFQGKLIAVALVLIVTVSVGFFILWISSAASRAASSQTGEATGVMGAGIVILLLLILLLVVATVVMGLRFSHRIVGPIYAINRHLNWVREGNYTRDLQLRDKDEFQNLGATMNAMQSALRRRTRLELESIARVETLLTDMKSALDANAADGAATAVDALAKELADMKKRHEGLLAV